MFSLSQLYDFPNNKSLKRRMIRTILVNIIPIAVFVGTGWIAKTWIYPADVTIVVGE